MLNVINQFQWIIISLGYSLQYFIFIFNCAALSPPSRSCLLISSISWIRFAGPTTFLSLTRGHCNFCTERQSNCGRKRDDFNWITPANAIESGLHTFDRPESRRAQVLRFVSFLSFSHDRQKASQMTTLCISYAEHLDYWNKNLWALLVEWRHVAWMSELMLIPHSASFQHSHVINLMLMLCPATRTTAEPSSFETKTRAERKKEIKKPREFTTKIEIGGAIKTFDKNKISTTCHKWTFLLSRSEYEC